MSAKALTYVWDHSPYTGTKRVIHIAIADVANEENGNRLWVSQGNIAHKAKCDRKTVTRTFAQMVDDGYLRLIKDNSAARKPNVYEFLTPRDISSPTRDISSFELGTFHPPLVSRCPSNSSELKRENTTSVREALQGVVVQTEFDKFWKVYPRKINKKKAFECFEKAANRAPASLIAERAAVWAKAWKDSEQEVQFIPHATTWLNADRWEDEPETVESKLALKGNAQAGKNFLTFEHESGRDLVEKLGVEVFGAKSDS
jgi:hypothetical protein